MKGDYYRMDYEKVQQRINDMVGDNVKKLAQLFPAAVKDGEVDFEALKEELGQFAEVDSEKYELTWAGKKNAKKIAQEDIIGKTLKFIPEDSKNADTTENLYIEGDNLEVLKLLRQNYYGAVKMIYIDPPYNTGNDFVYNDTFVMDKVDSDIEEGTINELGERFVINSKSQNRFHANWLNMIWSRLTVAKDLLAEDGMIFISIDDYERDNLIKICDEIFGDMSASGPFIWPLPRGINAGLIARAHEYILCYTKGGAKGKNFNRLTDDVEYSVERCNKKVDARHPISDITFRRGIRYEGEDKTFTGELGGSEKIIIQGELSFRNGVLDKEVTLSAGWTMKNMILDWMSGKEVYDTKGQRIVEFYFKDNGKLYSKKEMSTLSIKSILKDIPDTQIARVELEELLGSQDIFPYPKPIELVRILAKLTTKDNDIVLDFFSGAATTAHAIMKLNAEDLMNRKFILVQLQEECAENTDAYKNGYKNICEIGKERIRRAGEKIKQENPDANIDIGFKVFRVADTNIKWNSFLDAGQLNLSQIETTPDLIDFMPNSNDIDIVYELMLRQRDLPLSETLEPLSDIGNRTYLYASSYLVCLETEITVELVNKLAQIDPLPIKFIFRDSAFKDDIALKDETFRRLKALIDKNAGNSKVTYTVEFI